MDWEPRARAQPSPPTVAPSSQELGWLPAPPKKWTSDSKTPQNPPLLPSQTWRSLLLGVRSQGLWGAGLEPVPVPHPSPGASYLHPKGKGPFPAEGTSLSTHPVLLITVGWFWPPGWALFCRPAWLVCRQAWKQGAGQQWSFNGMRAGVGTALSNQGCFRCCVRHAMSHWDLVKPSKQTTTSWQTRDGCWVPSACDSWPLRGETPPQGSCLPVFLLLEPNSYYLKQTLWFWRPFCWRQGGKNVCCAHAQVPPGLPVHPWAICSSYRYPHHGSMGWHLSLHGSAD